MTRLIRDIGYFVILCLMIVGVAGLMYHAIRTDGWIERLMGGMVHQGVGMVLGIVIAVAAAFWLMRRWLVATQTNALFNDFLMYGLVALGMLFMGRLVLHGSF